LEKKLSWEYKEVAAAKSTNRVITFRFILSGKAA
jgi:hypothetical protein